MLAHIARHARERLNFEGDGTAAKRLNACKTFLQLEMKMILMRHRTGESGIKVAQARATLIDVLIGNLFSHALASWRQTHPAPPPPVAIIALGGYGRAELCPKSDIDIMFLHPPKTPPAAMKDLQAELTCNILYILWDAGLKVGHSSRTTTEAFEEARRDIQTKTSLLESRFITGTHALFESFQKAYRDFYLNEDPRGYINARLLDQEARRARYGGTVFLQEPDIKNGVGGLRDYQNALWMARVKPGIMSMDELATLHTLSPAELREFNRAYDFLLRVRNELHFQVRHPTDLLDLEIQPKVALQLGYTAHSVVYRVEEFMHDYYTHARLIHHISRIVENRLALSVRSPRREGPSLRDILRPRRRESVRHIDGFVVRGSSIGAGADGVFTEDPLRLIRVFRHCQQLGCQPDFALQMLIRASLPLLTRNVAGSPGAALGFRSILDEAGLVHPMLSLMHELGVLGRILPEFDQLTCLVQHEYYHRYTVDIHTLQAVEHLDKIFTASDPATAKYREELHKTSSPTLLYLILLLHDIGKSGGLRRHSESGATIAAKMLGRLGIAPPFSDTVIFIIKNHLAMAQFWQRHDLDDPLSAAAFAEIIRDEEKLRYLYVHTYCDARATSESLWNDYKDTLHTSLFRSTMERLVDSDAVERTNLERKKMTHQELISHHLPGISPDEITAHFNLMPDRYFIQTDADGITLHLQMVNQLLHSISGADSIGTLKPVVDWRNDINRGLTVVNVVTWDRAGLFSKLAGAFSVAGLNILSAKVISRADHIAIDTFHVVEPGRGVVQSTNAMNTFASTVEAALVQNRDLLPEIEAQAARIPPIRLGPSAGTPSAFPPLADVYHELSMKRIIVEIQAPDRIGLLYRLSRAIFEHGYDITFARINTERGVAIDTFYIESTTPEDGGGHARLTTLKSALMQMIQPPAEAAPDGPA